MHFTDAKVHTYEQDAYTMPIFPSPPHGSRPIDITVSSSRCAGAFERVARTGAGDVCRVRGCAARSTCSSASSNHEIPSVSFRSPSPRYEQLYDPRLADFRLQSKEEETTQSDIRELGGSPPNQYIGLGRIARL